MERLISDLTPESVDAKREEIRRYIDDSRRDRYPDVREWIREAVNPRTYLAELYRTLALDLEDDICHCLPAFQVNAWYGRNAAHYAHRMIWRVLMRRYAFGRAASVGRMVATYDEARFWLFWRRFSYLLPRLMIAVFAGFLLLSSSSTLMDILFRAKDRLAWRVTLPAVALLTVYVLAVADVQRRVGRMSIWVLLRRAAMVAGFGVLFGAFGALIECWLGPRLGFEAPPGYGVLSASAALVLGFVLQLFWQDQSIGDPL